MKSGLELLSELFANVPDAGEEVSRGRGRVVETRACIAAPNVPIPDPVEWLVNHGIPIQRTLDRNCGPDGMFMGRGVDSFVNLKEGADMTDARVQRTIWHEIGHAIDHLTTGKSGVLRFNELGTYSTKHKDVLIEHAELIVALRMKGSIEGGGTEWSEYARERGELWAELVAIVCTNPKSITSSPKLWDAVRPDMAERCLPLPNENSNTTPSPQS